MQPPLYLADESFDLLVNRVPNELLNGLPFDDHAAEVGMTREQFAAFLRAITADGRTSGFADAQAATTLRNALAVVLFALGKDFDSRVGYSEEEATEMLTQLNRYLRSSEGAGA